LEIYKKVNWYNSNSNTIGSPWGHLELCEHQKVQQWEFEGTLHWNSMKMHIIKWGNFACARIQKNR
jgi:hypothetical protein